MIAKKAMYEKPYKIECEDRPGYFYIHFKCGKLDLDCTRAFVREAAAELKRSGREKVLVELDVEERLSDADTFFLASEFPDLGFQDHRFAVVDARPGNEELNHFADAAAHNHEVTRRTFTLVEEAEQWLASN